jgi:hypothetical protein
MHLSNLPNDILVIVNLQLNQKAKFNLALTSKSMYEKCRHFRSSDVFDLSLTEQLGSFFHTTIINVNVHLNIYSIDYNALYTKLSDFYYLTSLTVRFSGRITTKIAYSFLSSAPIAPNSSLNLFVQDDHNYIIMNQVASSCGRKDIVVKRLNSCRTYNREKRKTPSPIREAIKSVKRLKTLYFEQQDEKDGHAENRVLPAPLTDIVDEKVYRLSSMNSDMLLKEVQSKQDAEDNIKNIISPKLLEAVIVFQKNWIFATQFEVYYRNNPYIDDAAMNTMMDKYSGNLVAKIKNKTEKGKSWFEVSIFWGRFEMLLTGGISGSKMSNDVVPFLGPSIPLKELVDGDSFTSENIYVNCHNDGIKAYFQVRSLRNWTKLSSSFEWACISSRFHRKGFSTVNLLEIRNSTPLVTLISIILHHICHKKRFEDEQYEMILQQFKASPALKDWSNRERVKNFATINEKLVANNGSKDLITLAKYMYKTKKRQGNPLELMETNDIVYLSAKLYTYARKLNKKALNCYRL